MKDFVIHSSICTAVDKPRHEIIYVTRGASASIDFSLIPKVYSFEDIEQATFLFRQGKTVKKYEMIVYPTPNDRTTWTLDPHFICDPSYSCITFMWSPQETAALELTQPDNNMQFEVVIKLDTDSLTSVGRDATIVEPQHPIAVIDSIYRSTIVS